MKSVLNISCAILLAVAFACPFGVSAAEKAYEIPFAAKAPVIDGVASHGEWDCALRIIGAGKPVDSRHAEIAFAWDKENLYVCTRSETAPRNRLYTSPKSLPGTTRIVLDDSVELWFDPPKELRNADETKRFGYFQMIVNHKGDVYGCHHNPGYGLPARDWKLETMAHGRTLTNDVWTLEMAIPAKAFGLKAFEPLTLPLLSVRNFRLQSGRQAPFLQPGGGFMDAANYPKMRLVRKDKGAVLDRRPAQAAPFVWTTPEACIVADRASTGIVRGNVGGVKIPVPGTMLMRTKTSSKIEKKGGWRRYFATAYKSTGYMGFQEDTCNGRTMLFFAHHFKGVNAVNKRLRCPADGREAVVAVSFEPKRMTYYLNGVKQGQTDLPMDLSAADLGGLVLNSGEPGLEILDWTLYRRTLSDAEVKAYSQGDSPLSGTLGWYPTINSLVADLTCDATKFPGGELFWKVTRRADGAVCAEGRISLSDGFAVDGGGKALTLVRKKLPLDVRLAEGEYLAAVFRDGDDVLTEKEFRIKNYEWSGAALGKEDRLLPGFTPVKAEGASLSCIGRTYELAANGLPAEIFADGEQILAAPVALHASRGGKVRTLSGSGKVVSRRISDTRVEYEVTAKGYSVRGSLEQDGLLRFTLKFSRLPALDRLWLEIPVKKEFSTLFHACGEGIRANPAGFTAKGEGVFFKSRDIPQTHVSNFIPYCWTGTDTRGIAYAADTDFGWVHTDKRDAVEMVRKADGSVSIELNLLNDLSGGIAPEIELALMASPVKPMPKGWRGWSDGFGYKGTQNSCVLASQPYWGNFTAWASRYPAWGEFEYVRKLREAMDTGKIDKKYVDGWIERVCANTSSETVNVNRKDPKAKRAYVHAHAWCGFNIARSLHGKHNPILYFYTCDSDSAATLAEYAVFRDEWAACKVAIPSYADYAIWYLDKMVEAGMQGVYDDNTFICCNFNWATGEAKVDENGVVHPSFGIWNSREYRRRQANVLISRGLYPWITVHHTNGNILPVLSFASNSMGMEWKYGPGDFQTRFTPDYIRAVCQGLQCGLFPTVLDGITGLGGEKNKDERIRVTRTMMASLLVHEVRPTIPRGSNARTVVDIMNTLMDFGIGKDDCRYWAYWNEENPLVGSDGGEVLTSVYRRGDKLLALCSSWTDGGREMELALKKGAFVAAKNAETGETLPVVSGKVRLPLAKHDLAIIELSVK